MGTALAGLVLVGTSLVGTGLVATAPARAATVPTCSDSWVNPDGGGWSDPVNWSGGVPGPTDVACIQAAGTYSVTVEGTVAVSGLVVGGAGSGSQTLATEPSSSVAVAGTLADLAGGSLDEQGSTTVEYNGTFDLDGGTTTGVPVDLGGANLDLATGGLASFALVDGFTVPVTGDVATDQSIELGSGNALSFTGPTTAAGTITWSGSSSAIQEVTGTLTNVGTIEAESGTTGTLTLGGSIDNQGTGSQGVVDDSSIIISGGTLTNDGTVSVASGATLDDEDALDNATGTIADGGTLTVGYNRIFDQGSGAVTGDPVELTGSVLGLDGPGAMNVIAGPAYAVEVTGTGTLAAQQALTVQAGAAVYGLATNDGTLVTQPGDAGVVFNGALVNDGSFEVGSGSTTSVSGGYTQGAGGSIQFDVGDPVAFGNLGVSGPVALAGGLITRTSGFTPSVGQSFKVVNCGLSPLTGTFSTTAFGAQPYTVEYGSGQLDLVAASGMDVTTAGLAAGEVGTPYQAPALTTSGSVGAVSWALNTATLPPGLVLDSSTGVVSGTPTEAGSFPFIVTAVDSSTPAPQAASASLDLTIAGGGLAVTTTTLPPTVVGTTYPTTDLTSTGGDLPVTWSVTKGKLPAGLSLDSGTGAVTGAATKAGISTVTVTATDSSSPKAETASAQLSVSVTAVLAVTTKSLPSGQVGQPYSASLASTGGTAPVTWAVTGGSLPAGLALNPASGAITGTPTGSGSTSPVTVTATDATAPDPLQASAAFSVTVSGLPLNIVAPPPTQSGGSLAGGQVGVPYAGTTFVSGGGSAPVSWSVTSGSLPAGLSLDPATGVLGGTPSTAGKSTFTVTTTDATTPTAQTAKIKLSISVVAPLVVATTALPVAQVGVPYSPPALAATGGTPPTTWALSGGRLPAGLSLLPTGQLTGTPTVTGTSSFTVTATDATTPTPETAKQKLSLVVNGPALAVTTSSLPGAAAAAPYGATLASTGGTAPVTWTVTAGSLPAGLDLDASTGAITGAPSSGGSVSTFTVTATDSSSPAAEVASASLSIAVSAPSLAVVTSSLPSADEGVLYVGATLASTGGSAPVTWGVTGKLPRGLSLSSAGQIAGTPTAAGTFTFTVTATDSSQPSQLVASAKLSMVVVPTLVVTTTKLPSVEVGAPYVGATLASTGGLAPITWAVTSGSLPAGLQLDPATGAISGSTGLDAVSSTFVVTATDSASPFQQASATLSLGVTGTPVVVQQPDQLTLVAYLNTPFTHQFQASGGTTPYVWSLKGRAPAGLSLDPTNPVFPGQHGSWVVQAFGGIAPYSFTVTAGSLPAGLTLDAATGVISGTVASTATGSYTATVTVADSRSPAATVTVTVSLFVENVGG